MVWAAVAIVLHLAIGRFFGASSLYLVLKVGLTVSRVSGHAFPRRTSKRARPHLRRPYPSPHTR